MCGGCSCCQRSISDIIIVSFLVLLTLYSTHHFYAYLFPHTLTAIWHGLVSAFRALSLESSLWRSAVTKEAAGDAVTHASVDVPTSVKVELVMVSGLSYTLFAVSMALWCMFVWAYGMAVWVAPGYIPFTFTQKEKLSASLSLNVFYEPLPYRKCAVCEGNRRKDSGSQEASLLGGSSTDLRRDEPRWRRNKDVYPPLPPVSTPSDVSRIHRFAPQPTSHSREEAAKDETEGEAEMRGGRDATTTSQGDTASGHGIMVSVEVGDRAAGRRQIHESHRDGTAATQPPSYHREDTSDPSYEHFFFNRRANAYTSVQNNYLNFCPLCFCYKPQRAHHCSKCNKCILKYDHHCPWLGRCVGFFNYKNYLLVLLYSGLLTTWALVLLTGAFVVCALERTYRGPGYADAPTAATVFSSPPLQQRGPKASVKGASPATATSPHLSGDARVYGRLLEELNVGTPTLGVLVCYAEALLFCVMSLYLLKRHYFFARHNITTIDLVIHEHERMLHRRDSSDEEDTEEDLEDEDGGVASVAGDGRANFMFDNNKKHYRERTLRRFLKKNVFDLGVRRNLLQVFGDAKLHAPEHVSDGCADADAVDRATPYFQDLMESDTFRHDRFVVRWFWRLLPLRAYPAQMRWDSLEVMKRRQTRASLSAHHSYGATADRPHAGDEGGEVGPHSNSILLEFGVTEKQLLGLRFPTKASLGL